MEERKQQTREFRVEAVRLLEQSDRPASESAGQLGVKRTLLYRWRDEVRTKGDASFGRPRRWVANQEDEIVRLRRELQMVTEDGIS